MACRVAVLPAQILIGLTSAMSCGNGFTLTVSVTEALQPLALVTVDEYTLVIDGDSIIELLVAPLLQLYCC